MSAAAVTTRRIINSGDAGTCQRASDYAPLARLPRGPMLAFIDSGPFILMESGHAVLAAPYHRNQAGNNAMLDMFLAAPDDAKAKLAAHGIDTVASAPAPRNATIMPPARPPASRRRSGAATSRVSWKEFPGSDLAVYRVRR